MVDLPEGAATTGIPAPAFLYDPPDGPLSVIHRDDDLLVLSKPSGLLSVPGKALDQRDCLESRAQIDFPTALTVHRLDRGTSGICVMALNPQAHRHLSMQFERRHTAKQYVAIVSGPVAGEQGEIDLPLRCDWPNRPRQMVDHEYGKASKTQWQVDRREKNQTRMLLTPITGRSHQLRVHMASLGHPILGDTFYASSEGIAAADRLMLHAQTLSFMHPNGGERLTFEDPAPF